MWLSAAASPRRASAGAFALLRGETKFLAVFVAARISAGFASMESSVPAVNGHAKSPRAVPLDLQLVPAYSSTNRERFALRGIVIIIIAEYGARAFA